MNEQIKKWCKTSGGRLFHDSDELLYRMNKKLHKSIEEKLHKSVSAYLNRKEAYRKVMEGE